MVITATFCFVMSKHVVMFFRTTVQKQKQNSRLDVLFLFLFLSTRKDRPKRESTTEISIHGNWLALFVAYMV